MKKVFSILTIAIICSLNIMAQTATADKGIVINGVKWATRNVGAPGTFVENIEDPGMFYQWNSTVGWSASDPIVSTDSSSWNREWRGNGSKTWKIANNVCPSGWRVPTPEEIQSLTKADSEWIKINGKRCRSFNMDGNSLVFPAAGYRYENGSLNFVNIFGYYWSNKIDGSVVAYRLRFNSTDTYLKHYTALECGLSVRCVAE